MAERENEPRNGNFDQARTSDFESDQGSAGDPGSTDEAAVDDGVKWQFKERLGIQDRMSDVVQKTLAAAKQELETTRKKLRKMQYGS